ncbi:MAG: ribose 5-phosphate isomerase B [Clostridia bacterium]|nr:ribose 5-phosphate isomerase B [Clostridia bacterium]
MNATANKTIVVGCDHAACDLKAKVITHLEEKGYLVTDVGTYTSDSCNYPDYAHAACVKIQQGEAALGILICGTGIGMSIAANKHRGIRAAVCADTFSARMTRMHNDANVLCFGARVVGEGLALDMVDAYLDAAYMGGKHQTRVDMITAIEDAEANRG